MDPRTKITLSSYWGKLDLPIQRYVLKQLEYLELKGKGLGINQNIHIYKDANGGKIQSNLICYLYFNTNSRNTIELRTHNPSSGTTKFTGAAYFNQLGLAAGTRYDLGNHLDILAFDELIESISNI